MNTGSIVRCNKEQTVARLMTQQISEICGGANHFQPFSINDLSGVKDYLERVVAPGGVRRTAPIDRKYLSFEDYVFDNGQQFIFHPLPTGYRHCRRVSQQCYCNAYLLAQDHPELKYAEGYAMQKGLMPVLHAWCVDDVGLVFDPTWRVPADYYGVIFDLAYVLHVFLKKKEFGVIDNWAEGFPLLHGDHPVDALNSPGYS
mgnify:CR=1 FL=1